MIKGFIPTVWTVDPQHSPLPCTKRKTYLFIAIMVLWIFGLTVYGYTQTPVDDIENDSDIADTQGYMDSWVPLITFDRYNETLEQDSPYAVQDPEREKVQESLNHFPDLNPDLLHVCTEDMKLEKWRVSYYPESERQADLPSHPVSFQPGTENNSRLRRLNEDQRENQEIPTAENTNRRGKSYLKVALHFPTYRERVIARIAPPFEIQEYNILGEMKGLNNGVINNVKEIYQIALILTGVNVHHRIGLCLKDEQGNLYEYDMGVFHSQQLRLNNTGDPAIDALVWVNGDVVRIRPAPQTYYPRWLGDEPANYLEFMTSRDHNPYIFPHEPKYLKFDSILVYGGYNQSSENIYLYFWSVDMRYEKELRMEEEELTDIQDDDFWQEEVRIEIMDSGRWLLKVPFEKQWLEQYTYQENLPEWAIETFFRFRPVYVSIENLPGIFKHYCIRRSNQHQLYSYFERLYNDESMQQRFRF